MLQIGRSLVRSQLVSLEFFMNIKSFRSHYVPGGSTQPLTEMSTRSISWGGKGGRCVRLTTLPPFCAVMKSGNLNFLEFSGPLQACNGTALLAYMFRAAMCPSSGELLYQCDIWFMSLCVDDRLVCRLTCRE